MYKYTYVGISLWILISYMYDKIFMISLRLVHLIRGQFESMFFVPFWFQGMQWHPRSAMAQKGTSKQSVMKCHQDSICYMSNLHMKFSNNPTSPALYGHQLTRCFMPSASNAECSPRFQTRVYPSSRLLPSLAVVLLWHMLDHVTLAIS